MSAEEDGELKGKISHGQRRKCRFEPVNNFWAQHAEKYQLSTTPSASS
jgi:hypothetical protein